MMITFFACEQVVSIKPMNDSLRPRLFSRQLFKLSLVYCKSGKSLEIVTNFKLRVCFF